jgi:peptidoglycan hydrolase-like protein with peptidoglycan-binding domain
MVATSGSGWRLAPSLVALMAEVDARWPDRDKSSDGSIGDQAHAARPSEHNPDRDSDPMPTGYVSAVDITKDSTAQVASLIRALLADPRTWYVIHDGHIWSRTHGFGQRNYAGANPHTHHVHVSLMQTRAAADDTEWWGVKVRAPKPPAKPKPAVQKFEPGDRVLREGATGRDVAFLQRWLGVTDDGTFGAETTKAVKRYQRMRELAQDGAAGPKTWAWILTGKAAG